MMVFRPKGKHTYKLRVIAPDGRSAILSTGKRVEEDADAVELMVAQFAGSKGDRFARPDVLALLVSKVAPLGDVYDHWVAGTLDSYLRTRTTPAAPATDLRPYLDAWVAEKEKSRKGAKSVAKYRTQVEALYPGPLTTATFTARVLGAAIQALKVQDPTRNRYKAAAASFGKHLVRHHVLDHNPTRDIDGWSEGEVRTTYYERATAQQVIAALAQPFAAVEALMCGAGLEWQAIERLQARDVDLAAGTVFGRGTKYRTRTREVRILAENAWCLPYIRPALTGKVGTALVFPGLTERVALARHADAVTAAKAEPSTLHDWRHTHAVQGLRDGYTAQVMAHQLGHANAHMVLTRYGVFVPELQDYVPRVAKGGR